MYLNNDELTILPLALVPNKMNAGSFCGSTYRSTSLLTIAKNSKVQVYHN